MTYIEKVEEILNKVDEELIASFKKVALDIGTRPLKFKGGKIDNSAHEILMNFTLRLEGYYCRVGSIGYETTLNKTDLNDITYLFIKAYRVDAGKYRLIKSYNLNVYEKFYILKQLTKKYSGQPI